MPFEVWRRAARAVGVVCSLIGLVTTLAMGGPASAAVSSGTAPRKAAGARSDSRRTEHGDAEMPPESRGAEHDIVEAAQDPRQTERRPVWLRSQTDAGAPILVYPPRDASRPSSPLVLLHGMCGHPENECPWFAGPASDDH